MQLTVDPHADKSYVRQLKKLISSLLSVSRFQHSVYGQASQFFQQQQQNKNALAMLQQACDQAQRQLSGASAKTEAVTRTNWLKRILIPRDFAICADVSIHLCWRGQAFAKLNRYWLCISPGKAAILVSAATDCWWSFGCCANKATANWCPPPTMCPLKCPCAHERSKTIRRLSDPPSALPRLRRHQPLQPPQPLSAVLQRPLQGRGFGGLGQRRVQTARRHPT